MSLWDSAEAKLIGEYFVGKSKIKVLFRFLLFFSFPFYFSKENASLSQNLSPYQVGTKGRR